jgi:DNA-binding CsgD family transcriptional regulator
LTRIIAFVSLILCSVSVAAQPANPLSDSTVTIIKHYALLADDGYTLDRVLSDTTLRFEINDSIRPNITDAYWLKLIIHNPSHYAERYNAWVLPNLDNSLFYFDANTHKWVESNATARKKRGDTWINRSVMPIILKPLTTTTVYIKLRLGDLKGVNKALLPKIELINQQYAAQRQQKVWIIWTSSILMLCLFFLNNLYVYRSFRDKTVLFYLLAQLGGMLYITAYWRISYVFLQGSMYNVWYSDNGDFWIYDFNSVIMHLGIMLTLYGFVGLTRSYLRTKHTLPQLDAVLKYCLYTYLWCSAILIIINVFVTNVEHITIVPDNVVVILLLSVIIYTCIAGHLRKLPAATPFLLANILSLAFMISIPLFHIFVSISNNHDLLLPLFASVAQALGFSIALVARTKSIQKELKAKETEAQRLKFNLREIELSQQLTEMENQKINTDIQHEKTRSQLLEERLEANQRELASTTLYMVQKNEMLAKLRAQLLELNQSQSEHNRQELKNIESILQSNLYLDADWGKFKLHFELVHPHFFEKLLQNHPSLTKNEIRLVAYFHINLSTKEIAALLNIDPASVRRAKTRLFKKMSLTEPV